MQLIGEEEISIPRLAGIHSFIKSQFRVGEQRALGSRNLANDGVIGPVGFLVGVIDVRKPRSLSDRMIGATDDLLG
jgi:hypothetical protein